MEKRILTAPAKADHAWNNLGNITNISCVSDGIYRAASFKTKLANDLERTQTVLYTFHYFPPTSSILYTLCGSLCPYESVMPKPSSLGSLAQ